MTARARPVIRANDKASRALDEAPSDASHREAVATRSRPPGDKQASRFTRAGLSLGTTFESADRSRADVCFALAEQASEQTGPARLVLVRNDRPLLPAGDDHMRPEAVAVFRPAAVHMSERCCSRASPDLPPIVFDKACNGCQELSRRISYAAQCIREGSAVDEPEGSPPRTGREGLPAWLSRPRRCARYDAGVKKPVAVPDAWKVPSGKTTVKSKPQVTRSP